MKIVKETKKGKENENEKQEEEKKKTNAIRIRVDSRNSELGACQTSITLSPAL
jgi:hypothetical protein